MRILLTGGAGYIGSHLAVALLQTDHKVVIVDNFVNSNLDILEAIEKTSGKKPDFARVDLLDFVALSQVFDTYKFDCVIHLAGLKSVAESVAEPLHYYENNIGSTLNLCEAMMVAGVRRCVFSSSATVYDLQSPMPLSERSPLLPQNPYGRSKLMCEQILEDAVSAHGFSVVSLRYFNPIGSHPTGLLQEKPHGIPNNLLPYIAQVAGGSRGHLNIFGSDYDTADGTAERDYIHIMDLCAGHLAALEHCIKNPGYSVFNLGTGHPSSVLEVVRAFETANSLTIPYKLAPRRAGDAASYFADPAKAKAILGFESQHSLVDMCKSYNIDKKS